jgi:hypothetical protein
MQFSNKKINFIFHLYSRLHNKSISSSSAKYSARAKNRLFSARELLFALQQQRQNAARGKKYAARAREALSSAGNLARSLARAL